jgi:hypothetical protein
MRTLFLLVAALAAWPMSASAAVKLKIAVFDVNISNVDPAHKPIFTEVLTTELAGLDGIEVISSKDIQAILGHEAQKQALGCSEDTCFAELGGALGAERLVVCDVGKLDQSYVVNAKLVNVAKMTTEKRAYLRITGGLDDVTSTIRAAVYQLFELDPPADLAAYTPGAATGPMAVALWIAGAAGIGAGAYFGLQAKEHYANSTDSHYNGAQLEVEKGESAQLYANVGFVAGGVLLASGVVLWLYQNRDDVFGVKPTVEITLAPIVAPDAAALSLLGRF